MVKQVIGGFAVVAIVLWSGNAFGTPGSGVTPSFKVVSANANINVQSMAGKLLLLEFGKDRTPINILNVHQTFAPGGYSGWHTHAGPGIVIVEQGTITIEETAEVLGISHATVERDWAVARAWLRREVERQ